MRLGHLVIPWMVFLLLFLAVLMYIWSRAHWPDICACGDYPPTHTTVLAGALLARIWPAAASST